MKKGKDEKRGKSPKKPKIGSSLSRIGLKDRGQFQHIVGNRGDMEGGCEMTIWVIISNVIMRMRMKH